MEPISVRQYIDDGKYNLSKPLKKLSPLRIKIKKLR